LQQQQNDALHSANKTTSETACTGNLLHYPLQKCWWWCTVHCKHSHWVMLH